MGVEVDSFYTADVTRTLPIDGRFRDVQRRVYDVVLAAQQAGIDATKPGADFLDPHRAAMAVIAEALEDWGFLAVPAAESLQEDVGLHRRYTLHSTSHMLGLDVHDCANARAETYQRGPLARGHGADGRARAVLPGRRRDRAAGVSRASACASRTTCWSRRADAGCFRTRCRAAADDVEEWVRELQS